MKMRALIVCVVALSLAGSGLVQAANRDTPYSRTSLFFLYNGWTEERPAGDEDLNQAVAGLSIHQIVSPRFDVELTGTYSSTSLSAPSTDDVDLSSVNDTRVRATGHFGEQRQFTAALKLNLPTGQKELADDEYALTVGLADNARQYYVRRVGQGLDVGGELLFQPMVDDVRFTLGGGYLYKGSYQIRADDTDDYKYGDEISGIAGVAYRSQPVDASLTGTYTVYTDDEFGEESVFKSGPSLIISGRASYTESFHASVAVTAITRGNAELPAGEEGALTEENLKSGRDELQVDANAVIPLQERLRLLGRLAVMNVSANEYDSTSSLFRPKANHVGVGAGFGYQFTLGLWGSVVGTYYTGKVDEDNDLTGLGISAALILRYW
ncbi:MAG: hypothetical protein GF341_13125 [candidate division Zixibacteria bacterium]|nr:hypothetical protein [candidate division Zixibacteria bacterium]